MSSPAPSRRAVLDCEDAVKWDGHAIALSRLLSVDGERWERHRCWSGELPELSELDTYAGLVVTGSHHGANDDEPWIDATRRFLAEAATAAASGCWASAGCQLDVARALGGASGPTRAADSSSAARRFDARTPSPRATTFAPPSRSSRPSPPT